MKKATLFRKLAGNRVECLACSWYCKIAPDQSGICAVRQNRGGELYLTVYGQAAAAHVDPIEKKPLFHFLPGQAIFSFGTLGCNFACLFCQNWDISQAAREMKMKLLREKKAEELGLTLSQSGLDLPPEKIIEICRERKIPAVAFTYNEPTIFFEYAFDTMVLAKKEGLKTVFVSNGYASSEAIETVKGYLDAINIDLKSFREEFYRKTCQARLLPVLEGIKRYHAAGIWVEVTTLVIPGENDSTAELTAIARFLSGVSENIPWHLSRFHPDYQMTDRAATPAATLERAYEIGRESGLKFVYLGNVLDENRESTFCPSCRTLLIRRRGYGIETVNLKEGRCGSCQTPIAGVWP